MNAISTDTGKIAPASRKRRHAKHTNKPSAVRKLLAISIATLSIGLVGSLSVSGQASAHTTGGNATGGGQWHPWPSDGCTKAPNWIPGVFNFTHSCQHHDGCYVNRWAARKTCDDWFLNDLRASCHQWPSTLLHQRVACFSAASLYHSAVRAFGDSSYNRRAIDTPFGDIVKKLRGVGVFA